MKQYVTVMLRKDGGYTILEKLDYKFALIFQLLDPFFYISLLGEETIIQWFMNQEKTVKSTEWMQIEKEDGVIALYDTSAEMDFERRISKPDPLLRFEMSIESFATLLFEWEKLRISKPEIVLIVIHEDNHVSLETDPITIKEYQDAGYAFDITKAPQRMEQYVCYNTFDGSIISFGLENLGCQLDEMVLDIQQKNFQYRDCLFYFPIYKYYNSVEDMFYFGSYEVNVTDVDSYILEDSQLPAYVNDKNSCKISRLNFIEFEKQWLAVENNKPPFILVYRNKENWVCCKDFQTKEEMYDFMVQPF
ncbi:hypothetical protein KBC04_00210 [Candidatus Babeliales bacterium]|nr:hypothetical protein [Candidatus Babeliales bacterium]MBP9843486.1 hypothetical protein [Candidatus Babeliales bacterium]